MKLSREEILEYARRYISEEQAVDFPLSNELFCFIEREIPPDRVLNDDEGWQFGGYGICEGYTVDQESKPAGKWILFSFFSLHSFPPSLQAVKLQPPHIACGSFQNATRDKDIRIIKIPLDSSEQRSSLSVDTTEESPRPGHNIIQFRPSGTPPDTRTPP
jgi:hypothetical protein